MSEAENQRDEVEWWDYWAELPVEAEHVDVELINKGAGWGELRLTINGMRYVQRVSLALADPSKKICKFFDSLSAGVVARMELYDEPGSTEVIATPTANGGQVLLECWLISPSSRRKLDLAANCSAEQLRQSMYDNFAYLREPRPAPPPKRSMLRRLGSFFFGGEK